jgi:hypothetical protein
MSFPKRQGRLWAKVGLLAIVAVPLAAVGGVRKQTPGVRPGVRMDTVRTDADTVRAVVAQGRDTSLHFVTERGAGDEQLLHLGTCPGTSCRHGPVSVIQPWEGAYELSGGWLEQGRIIARIITRDTGRYPKYGIYGQDTVYWWAGLRHGEPVSVFTSTYPGARPAVRSLTVDSSHAGYKWRQSIARWLWDPRDEMAWATCEIARCCRS